MQGAEIGVTHTQFLIPINLIFFCSEGDLQYWVPSGSFSWSWGGRFSLPHDQEEGATWYPVLRVPFFLHTGPLSILLTLFKRPSAIFRGGKNCQEVDEKRRNFSL
jgi:hypothetical protein